MILEPEQWIAQRLPIADSMDHDLSSGDWFAVLHRHDCSARQEAVPRYEHLASMGQRVALIDVPPYAYSPSLASACCCCRLNDDHDWFVQTPVEIRLHDGVVTAVRTHDH